MLKWSARDAVDARHRGAAGGWVRAVAATAVVAALLAALSACGGSAPTVPPNEPASAPASSPAAGRSASPGPSGTHPGSPPPVVVGGVPNIAVVRLSSRFTPGTLRLGTGQHFEVIVSKHVKPTGSGISGQCTPAAAARFSSTMLSLRCEGGSYLYTAQRAGRTALTVTVKPVCAPGTMCPQWVAAARLTLTIS